MTKILRSQTFETNSSSNHSFTINTLDGFLESNFPPIEVDEAQERFITVALEGFSYGDCEVFNDLNTKLAYLLTGYKERYLSLDDYSVKLYELQHEYAPLMNILKDTLCIDYILVTNIHIAYIDHDSTHVPIDICETGQLYDFLFNSRSELIIK